jgi:hypothetical protein
MKRLTLRTLRLKQPHVVAEKSGITVRDQPGPEEAEQRLAELL